MSSGDEPEFYDDGGSDDDIYEDALEELALQAKNMALAESEHRDAETKERLQSPDNTATTVTRECLGGNINNDQVDEKPELNNKDMSFKQSKPESTSDLPGPAVHEGDDTEQEITQDCLDDNVCSASSSSSASSEMLNVGDEGTSGKHSNQPQAKLHERLNAAEEDDSEQAVGGPDENMEEYFNEDKGSEEEDGEKEEEDKEEEDSPYTVDEDAMKLLEESMSEEEKQVMWLC